MKNFLTVLSAYVCKYGCMSCCGGLDYNCLCMVVFVIAHCLNMYNIETHRTTAAEAHISSSAVILEQD